MTIDEALGIVDADAQNVSLWARCDPRDRRQTPDSLRGQALTLLAEAVREQAGKTCDTCAHQADEHGTLGCELADNSEGEYPCVACAVFVNTRGAWHRRVTAAQATA